MSRLGRAAQAIIFFVILYGFLPQDALAGPGKRRTSQSPTALTLFRNTRVYQNADGGNDVSTFQNFYDPEIDPIQLEQDPFYWRLPTIIESMCRNSAEVSFSEYLYCVDTLINFVTEDQEKQPQ